MDYGLSSSSPQNIIGNRYAVPYFAVEYPPAGNTLVKQMVCPKGKADIKVINTH
jgi:hypothetical protein